MLCAISSAVPENPVVDTKNGYVFEKTLIEKYLDEKGTNPMTGDPMTKDDLLPLKMGKPIKPRHSAAMSIPGLLGMLHNEYDSIMLETHEMREALRMVRMELAQSLYQHDAACRLIARLTQERDQAHEALADMKTQVSNFVAQAPAEGAAAGPEGPPTKRAREEVKQGLSEEAMAEIDGKRNELSAARKARDANLPGLASQSDLEALSCALSQPVHSPSHPGILDVALQPAEGPVEPKLAATGGADHSVKVLDVQQGVLASTLAGHSKKVTSVTFAGRDVIVSGSSDKTVRTWRRQGEDASKWASSFTYDAGAPIVQTITHPVDRFVVALCSNATWSMLDVAAARPVWRVQDSQLQEYVCGAMHPDGNFFAAGGARGGLQLFDVRAQPLMSISEDTGVVGAVRSVSFNENGYWAALACDEGVQIWDLRKVTKSCVVATPFDEPASCVAWDISGKYLACGGPSAVKVYEVINKGKKKGAESKAIKSLHDLPGSSVNSLAFGALAHSLYVAAGDHNLRVYRTGAHPGTAAQ